MGKDNFLKTERFPVSSPQIAASSSRVGWLSEEAQPARRCFSLCSAVDGRYRFSKNLHEKVCLASRPRGSTEACSWVLWQQGTNTGLYLHSVLRPPNPPWGHLAGEPRSVSAGVRTYRPCLLSAPGLGGSRTSSLAPLGLPASIPALANVPACSCPCAGSAAWGSAPASRLEEKQHRFASSAENAPWRQEPLP